MAAVWQLSCPQRVEVGAFADRIAAHHVVSEFLGCAHGVSSGSTHRGVQNFCCLLPKHVVEACAVLLGPQRSCLGVPWMICFIFDTKATIRCHILVLSKGPSQFDLFSQNPNLPNISYNSFLHLSQDCSGMRSGSHLQAASSFPHLCASLAIACPEGGKPFYWRRFPCITATSTCANVGRNGTNIPCHCLAATA